MGRSGRVRDHFERVSESGIDGGSNVHRHVYRHCPVECPRLCRGAADRRPARRVRVHPSVGGISIGRNIMPITLTTGEQLQIRQAAERLQRQFSGTLNTETIERLMNDSLDTLVGRATTSTWIPLLAERFARDRLRALVRLESDP